MNAISLVLCFVFAVARVATHDNPLFQDLYDGSEGNDPIDLQTTSADTETSPQYTSQQTELTPLEKFTPNCSAINLKFMETSASPFTNNLNVTWTHNLEYCNVTFEVIYEGDGTIYNPVNTTEASIELKNLQYCTDHTIFITPYLDGKEGSAEHVTGRMSADIQDDIKNVSATAIGYKFNITWLPPDSAKNCDITYEIQCDSIEFKATTKKLSILSPELSLCETYNFVITAKADDAENTFSEAQLNLTLPFAAVVVQNITSDVSFDSANVSWVRPKNSEKCNVTYSVKSDNTTVDHVSNDTATISGLDICSSYTVRVQPVLDGNPGNTTPATVTTTPNWNDTIKDLEFTVKNDSVLAKWDIPSEMVKCNVQYHVFSENANVDVTIRHKEHRINNLTYCTNYSVEVTPLFNGERAQTTTGVARTLSSLKGGVQNFYITRDIDDLLANWERPIGTDHCNILYNVGINATGAPAHNITANHYKFNVTACTAYEITVTAIVEGRLSDPAVQQSSTLAGVNGSSIYNVTIKPSNDSIELTWLPPKHAQHCNITYVIHPNDTDIPPVRTTHKSHVFYDLSTCSGYEFDIRPLYKNETGQSTHVSAYTMPNYEGVSDLTVRRFPEKLRLRWEAPPDQCQYTYQVKWDDGDKETNKTSFEMTRLTPCTYYNFSVDVLYRGRICGPPVENYIHTTPNKNISLLWEVTPLEHEINVTWEIPAGSDVCEFSYQLSYTPNGTVIQPIYDEQTTVVIENLHSCNLYNITLTLEYEDKAFKHFSKRIRTLQAVPSAVRNLEAKSEDPDIIITWQAPEKNHHCVANYTVVYWTDAGHTDEAKTTSESFAIKNRRFCTTYNISVGSVTATKETSDLTYTSSYEKQDYNPPQSKYNSTTKNSVTIVWMFKSKDCLLYGIETNCTADAAKNQGDWIVHNRMEYKKITTDNSSVAVELRGLSPFTNYTCYGYLHGQAGNSSNSQSYATQTSEDVPDPPDNFRIKEMHPDYFEIHWDAPDKVPGILQNYNITVKFVGYKYEIPEGCPHDTHQTVIERLDVCTLRYGVYNAEPFSEYSVTLTASTRAGASSPLTRTVYTLEGSPEAASTEYAWLNKSTLDRYDMSLNITWRTPCKANGLLREYQVSVSGQWHTTFDEPFNRTINANRHLYSLTFDEVQPEHNYTVTIDTKTRNSSNLTSVLVLAPSGIPEVQMHETFNITVTFGSKITARVNISSDVFSDSKGDIRYYAIILAENSSMESPQRSYYDGKTWPDLKDNNYQITERKRWQPFANQQYTTYAIGTGNCTSHSYYCNPSLQKDKTYGLKLRGFTANGYRDTNVTEFITVIVVDAGVPVGLIIGLIVVIMGLALVIMAAVLYSKGKFVCPIWPAKAKYSQSSAFPLPVPVKKFPAHYKKMMENRGKISNEYQLLSTLSKDLLNSTRVALLPINRKKNRYINILPYDETRVELQVTDTSASDYINASFITGYNGNPEYIASQGPTQNTCPSFWQMIFEQDVKLIVMLAQFIEMGKNKCFEYFPTTEGESMHIGDLTIQCLEEQVYATYTYRVLHAEIEDDVRVITHIQFTEWPDFGVPSNVNQIIDFVDVMDTKKSNHQQHLIIVHCSAGVGRTGTLIAVDILMQSIRDKKKIDIFGTVYNLRKQRMNMVQTENQYEFLFKCIFEVVYHREKFRTQKSITSETSI